MTISLQRRRQKNEKGRLIISEETLKNLALRYICSTTDKSVLADRLALLLDDEKVQALREGVITKIDVNLDIFCKDENIIRESVKARTENGITVIVDYDIISEVWFKSKEDAKSFTNGHYVPYRMVQINDFIHKAAVSIPRTDEYGREQFENVGIFVKRK